MTRKKIVYCMPCYSTSGGTERTISNKANYFADVLGYDVAIVSTEKERERNFYHWSSRIKLVNLDINYLHSKKLNLIRKTFSYHRKHRYYKKSLATFLDYFDPDIVISCFWHDYRFIYDINHRSLKVLEFHFTRFYKVLERENVTFIRKIVFGIVHWNEKRIAKKYDRFVLLTERDRGLWGNPANSLVIPNMCTFYSDKAPDYTAKRVVSVGRLSHQKGFDFLIGMWLKVKEKFPDWELHIFGDSEDSYKSMLVNLIAENGLEKVVHIHASTSNIVDEYLKSSIYVMTSRYEGMPMVLIEAMSIGLPVVAFDCNCGPSELITNGVNGYLADVEDNSFWFKGLFSLMNSFELRKKMGEKSRREVNILSPDIIMKKWIELVIQ